MIELVSAEDDDATFLFLTQRIVNGAIAALQVREIYLVHVDNWFDHKWLGWWSAWEHKKPKDLYVPPFNPNRIRSQRHFVWDAHGSQWTLTEKCKLLHPRQPGRRSSQAQPLDRIAKSAAFIWYSGNTVANGAGALMLYVSAAEGYAWYASLRREGHWKLDDEFQITRRELVSFEERGRQMELMQRLCAPSD